MAIKTWVGTTSAWGTAGNWSPSGVPTNGDTVRIPAGSGAIAGSDTTAVTHAAVIVEPGYSNTIGSSSTNLKILCTDFQFSGTGAAYIDLSTSAISPQVFNSATASTGLRGLYLLGSALSVLNVVKGSVGLAYRSGETATITTVRVAGDGASVWLGSGVSVTNVYQFRGDSLVNCAVTTVTCYGGTMKTGESGAITTVNAEGGSIKPESTGTITTLNCNGGQTDFTGSGASRTVTNLKQNPGSILIYDPNVLTVTTRVAPDKPIALSSTLA